MMLLVAQTIPWLYALLHVAIGDTVWACLGSYRARRISYYLYTGLAVDPTSYDLESRDSAID